MDATAGYALVSVAGLVSAIGPALVIRSMHKQHIKVMQGILTKTPPCTDCGRPTESPRMVQCDRCHARACGAVFRAHAASLGIDLDRPADQ